LLRIVSEIDMRVRSAFVVFALFAAMIGDGRAADRPKNAKSRAAKAPKARVPALRGSAAPAAETNGTTVVYRGARIETATGAVFDPGALVVAEGKIVDVGPADKVAVPKGASVRDVSGNVIIPGLVDTHSHLGVYSRPAVEANSDGNEMTGPIQGIVRALDSLNPFDPGIRMANAGGVTTANIMPGSGNVIGGQTIYVKLRGYTPEQMWIASPDVLGGLKMANGENPKRSYGGKGKAPGTRMKVAALQRSEFIKARNYMAKWDQYRKKLATGEKVSPPDVDISLEPLVEAMTKRRTVHFHTHRADDILTVLRLKEEFGFELVIQHGTESYKVIEAIARHKVPVSMTLIDSPGGKPEVVDLTEQCGAELARAGIKVLVNTDDPVTESRFLLRTAAIAVRGGLSTEQALEAVTINGAQALHLDFRLGSLEKGKDADFVILSGQPFSVYSRVLETYIDGKRVFRLADDKDRAYQMGGFALLDHSKLPAAKPFVTRLPPVKKPDLPAKSPAGATGKSVVVLAGRLFPVSGPPIENAAVLVRDGKIAAVGPRDSVKIPPNTPVVSAESVTPGLIDANSIVPLSGQLNVAADQDADEKSDPNQAELRVLDAFNPGEPLLRFLLEQGVTVIHACPGRENVIAGITGVFRTHGTQAEAMVVRFPHALLFNLGEAPKQAYKGQRPETRMGTAALIRQSLTQAVNYRRKRENPKAGEPPLDTDLKLESLLAVLDRKVPALFAAQKADDLMTAVRLVNEFHLDGQLSLAAEAYLVTDPIAAAKIPVIVHPTMQRAGESMETLNSYLGNAAALGDAKIPFAIGSGAEGYVPKTRVVRFEAAMAMVYGLGRDAALRAVTLDAAKILKIDHQYGSIEPGKAADLVLYDGDPFEHATHVTSVFVDGRLVYDRATRKPLPITQRTYLTMPEMPCCLGW
jgi:imidazolonepropionase-like amidohydrolase